MPKRPKREMARSAPTPTASETDRFEDVLAEAAVTAHAAISLSVADVELLRTKPGRSPALPQITKTLRNSDPQTVAAVAALLQAIDRANWTDRSFAEWAVVASPRFVGRTAIFNTVWRFVSDSKYSINPHVIPNYSLHSPSGTASIALAMHGQNFGVGGGPHNAPEGLVTALSVLAERRLPGLWLLLSENDPEPIPNEQGNPTNAARVHAVALALQSLPGGVGALRLLRNRDADSTPNSVASLAAHIASRSSSAWTCAVDGLGELELTITGDDR
jgi:hypothetical protein